MENMMTVKTTKWGQKKKSGPAKQRAHEVVTPKGGPQTPRNNKSKKDKERWDKAKKSKDFSNL